jgi:cholesterol oxidase
VTLTGSVFPNRHTHIEVATYGSVGDSFGLNFVPLTGDGSRLTRPLRLVANVVRRPRDFLESQRPSGYSRRTVFVAAMQTHDNALRLRAKRRRLRPGVKLTTEQDPERPNPTFIPEIYAFTRRLAERVNGIPQSWLTEALANIPVTAHILGGAVVGTSPETAVIDPCHRVFGYQNLLVCDGSAVPANPGYNPSLTITAMAERAMSLVSSRP